MCKSIAYTTKWSYKIKLLVMSAMAVLVKCSYLDFRMASDTLSRSVCTCTSGAMSNMNGLFGGLNWMDHHTQMSYSMLICKVDKSGVLCKMILGLMFIIFIADLNY